MNERPYQETIVPKKIGNGSHVRVIAPARSLSFLSRNVRQAATDRLRAYGFHVSFGRRAEEMDEFSSSSVASRILDIHEAFADTSVQAVLTAIGGYNSNQLLGQIDYGLIARNPKILCGFSDITALTNAITSETGLLTYSGPHFSSWAMRQGFEYSADFFLKCCTSDCPFDLAPAPRWSDDRWYLDQDDRAWFANEGYWVVNAGVATGRLVGGNCRCLNGLQGTKYWPGLNNSVLFLEEVEAVSPRLFDSQLESLMLQQDFSSVRAVLIGRFQKETGMTASLLRKIISTKPVLAKIPVIANVDFGHTTPIVTLPIGGEVSIQSTETATRIRITQH